MNLDRQILAKLEDPDSIDKYQQFFTKITEAVKSEKRLNAVIVSLYPTLTLQSLKEYLA